MQHYTLELFRKDDSRFELRVFDGQTRQAFPLVEQAEMDALLALTSEDYRVNAADLALRGQALFAWVDTHSHGWLRRIRQIPQPLALGIDVREAGLRHLPWELLHDGNQFLCADPLHLFTPLRLVSERKHDWQPQKRQLGVLFMASSPEDVQPVLDFEAEEAGILQATQHKPLDLQVEESGSLPGLEERLRDLADAPDVIHLSGHAGIHEGQPVFLLEDDVGQPAPAAPQELAKTFVKAGRFPRIAFLSGCRTGESSVQHNLLSFSEQVVNAGVPVVLGWALPVGDVAASQAAAALYEKLANGDSIAEAVAYARQQLLEQHSPYWHLLRCHVDASPLEALVGKGRIRVRKHHTPQQFLDAGGRVPVCARERFIGRRRLLQRSLRSLRAWQGDAAYAEGILLHGMGGLGKSSTAARLVDRLRNSYTAVVCYGGLDETALVAAIGKVLPKAQSLLNDASQTLEQRLRELFEPEDNPYSEQPLLLVFDDFEQNIPLAQRQQSHADYSPASLYVLHTVLHAIHHSQSDTRVIVTSRFDVPVPQPCKLHAENPQTLHDADLKKKLAQLPGLQRVEGTGDHDEENALRAWAVGIAAGNPRLLEWLDKVLRENALDTPALLDKLAQEEARFREEVLISALVEAQTAAVRHTLACAALYRLPVQLEAITALSDNPDTAQHLQTAARVGLVEISDSTDGKRHFVSNLLDAALADELSAAERQPLAAQASRHLYDTTLGERSEAMTLEIIRLAVLGQEQGIAVEVGNAIATNMFYASRYREAESVCQLVLTLGEDFRILTRLARAEQMLGGSETRQHIERAVQILPIITDDTPKDTLGAIASTYLSQASFLQQQGRLNEALDALQNYALPIYGEKLGDAHQKAVTMGNISDILQAHGQLDDALNTLNETLPVYEKSGDVYSKTGTMLRIAGILQVRGQIDDALNMLNEALPVYEKLGNAGCKTRTMVQIADILRERGQIDDALNMLNEALPVYEKLGDVSSKAGTMGQIANILQARGQLDDALNIRQTEQLPVYEKLGDVSSKAVTMVQIADILRERGQLDDALNMLNEALPVHEKLGDVSSKARTMGKIAAILQARGQLDDALNIRENHELPVYEKLGNVRSKAVTMCWIATLLRAKDPKAHRERIRELLCQAKHDFLRMRLPEATSIQKFIENYGLSCDDSAPISVMPTPSTKQGTNRNALCSCGSGKRYKHCCGQL
ncbi:MAG: tetratricopeptide repeat protein [Candidatus Thiothrix moscowensis]|nr:tetratricopeptide repeat protein [Candidatus Thiothrix moscowensis]